MSRPTPIMARTNLCHPKKQKATLKKLAKQRGVPLNELIRTLLDQALSDPANAV